MTRVAQVMRGETGPFGTIPIEYVALVLILVFSTHCQVYPVLELLSDSCRQNSTCIRAYIPRY